MAAPVIDKLKLVEQLEDSGFERRLAERLAHALDEALGERVLTKADLDEALHPIRAQLVEFAAKFEVIDQKFEALDAKFEAKFDALDSKFDALDSRFDALDSKFDALDSKFDALNSKFGALDSKFGASDSRIDALDSKVDASVAALGARIDALATNLRVVTAVMLFGFTLLTALGFYNATQLRQTSNPMAPPVAPSHQEPAPPNPPPS